MKHVILKATVLSFAVSAAHAADFEMGLGSGTDTNGTLSIGFTGLMSDKLRWRLGSEFWNTKFNRIATPFAAADDIAAGEGNGPYIWSGSQFNKELYATLAPEWQLGKYVVSVEGGLTFYKPIRHQDIAVGTSGENASWNPTVSPIIGFSVGYGKTSIVFQIQQHVTVGDNEGGFFPQIVSGFSIRERF